MNSVENPGTIQKTFIEHIHELRGRLLWIALFAAGFGGLAYGIHEKILDLIQRPLGQTLYFTSPTGGFSFIFKLCFVTGLVLSMPVIFYHVFGFLGPLLARNRKRTIIIYTFWSSLLAAFGLVFAYFISLPAALHFLTSIGGNNIESLIGANEYFNFALAYLAGFAALFQLPLVVSFINRIKPLKPSGMMKAQKYVILGSLMSAAVLTPTPDPFNMLIMAVPMVFLYQFSIGLVWLINRKRPPEATKTPTAAVTPVGSYALASAMPEEPKTPREQLPSQVVRDITSPSPRPNHNLQKIKRPEVTFSRRASLRGNGPKLIGNDFL